MTRISKYRIIVLLLSTHPMMVVGQTLDVRDSSYQRKAQQLVDRHIAAREIVGAAAGFSIDGILQWQYAAGYADVEAEQPFTPGTITRIASISKSMSAIAIMQLVEQNKIDLDASIRTYIPEFPEKQLGMITVRHLLNHSAGIGGYKNSKERENTTHYGSLTEAMAIFKERDLIAEPGKAFNYTSYGYVVLGVVIERVSGLSFVEYLRRNIWKKAGMSHTGVEVVGQDLPTRAGLYHVSDKGKVSTSDRTDLSDRVPGGGIYSCLTDMLKFGDAVLDGTLIEPSTLQRMLVDPGLKREGNGYGLGWYLFGENPKYGPVFGHNGSQTGASTFLMLLPEQGASVVVLSNTSGAMRAVTDITIALFDIVAEAKAHP